MKFRDRWNNFGGSHNCRSTALSGTISTQIVESHAVALAGAGCLKTKTNYVAQTKNFQHRPKTLVNGVETRTIFLQVERRWGQCRSMTITFKDSMFKGMRCSYSWKKGSSEIVSSLSLKFNARSSRLDEAIGFLKRTKNVPLRCAIPVLFNQKQ